MNAKNVLEAAEKLIAWADANGQPDKPITFPAEMKKRITPDADGRWKGHPVHFIAPTRKTRGRC